LQQLLAARWQTGLYDQHVAKIEKRYGHKARVMKQALAEHFPPNVEIWESGGGLYFWARLPKFRHRCKIKSLPDRAEK
jgi:DNA-binding transcriptional MocR family regulator